MPAANLTSRVRSGVIWSTATMFVLRVSGMALGIVLAWLLTPAEFGVYAIALTVQGVLMALADFGLSADLIRSNDPDRRAPTVATLGLVTGGGMALVMVATAPVLAPALGSAAAGPAIAVLSLTMLFAGAGVVPYATLLRRFDQKSLFVIGLVDFVVSTTITIGLILLGGGVMSLAVGRVSAQLVTTVLQFVFARQRPRYGVDRSQLGSILRFGVPVSAANLLSWALLGIDKVIIGIAAGPIVLGIFVLAANISSWPMTAVGQVVRSIGVPLFSRTRHRDNDDTLAGVTAITWGLALPLGAGLAALAAPLVLVVYGDKWADAAAVLAVLAVFGSIRSIFDVWVSALLANGASGSVLLVQVVWIVVLAPALFIGVGRFGIIGAAYAHILVAVGVVLPAYLIALRRERIPVTHLGRTLLVPLLAVVPAVAGAVAVTVLVPALWAQLVIGGLVGAGIYAALAFRGLRRWMVRLRSLDAPAAPTVLSSVSDTTAGSTVPHPSQMAAQRPSL